MKSFAAGINQAKKEAYLKPALIWLFLSLILAGCSGIEWAPHAYAMSTPYETATPLAVEALPTSTSTPTTVVFEMKPTSTPLPTTTLPPAELNIGFGPQDFPVGIDPLTGQPVGDPGLLNRRAMAIKVTNFPRSVRPQWGLSQADNVYEYYLENLITRFIGVFYGKDASRVGPVRSGRFFDEHIVRMYKSIFVFAYADDRVIDPWMESDLKNFLVIERGDNCPPLCRIGSKYNYNTLYANTQQLSQYITERGTNNDPQDLTGLRFEQNVPPVKLPGNRVGVYYSFVSYNHWDYDSSIGRYRRFQEADDDKGQESYKTLDDSLTGEQITADNVVVLLIPHEYYIHTKTTEMVKMNFMGEGKAYAFRDGFMYPIQWRRDTQESLLSLEYPGGAPYPLKPGNTWFQVVGESSQVAQLSGDTWRFEFHIP
jgi:hypothetical protein